MNQRKHYIISALVIVSVGLPFLQLLLWSASNRWFYPDLLPQSWGIRAWEYVFGTAGEQIGLGIFQSAGIAAVTALLSLLIGVPAGRALGMHRFRGKDLIAVLLTLPVVVPPLCIAMGLHLWFIKLGLADSFLGVIMVHLTFCLPYTVFVMWGVFSNYNPDFEAQARSLGASTRKVVMQVMLPMTLSGMIVAALFSFLLSWSQYLATLIIGGGKVMTLPILLFSLMESGDRPVAAAVSIVFVLPAFVALFLSAKYLGKHSAAGVW